MGETNSPKLKTKGLTEMDVQEICKEIGCERDQIKSSPGWCYFPAHPDLSESIHYEFIDERVQFHIECEAVELRECIKGILKSRGKAKTRYYLENQTDYLVQDFRELKKAVTPYIEQYLSNIKKIYSRKAGSFEKQKRKLEKNYPRHLNFFEMLSNCNDDGNNESLGENKHTRILLAILKAGGEKLLVLQSFIEDCLHCNIDTKDIKISDIVFNKRYDDNGSNFIDGLICKHGEYAIIIENKIRDAGDQPQQIERYINALKEQEQVPLDKIWVIYLTKDGTLHGNGRPTADSYDENAKDLTNFNIGDNLICINYHDDILPWLKEEVLPRIKYTESSMAWGTDCYIDYLERMFHEDAASLKMAEKMKKAIFGSLNIKDADSIDKRYRKLNEPVKGLSCTTLYEDYVEVLRNYIREIEKPLFDALERATIDYFKEKGKDVVVRNKLSSGYIQIFGKDWNPLVHYEWNPVSLDTLFFGTKPINLCIHIEGNELKDKKEKFNNITPICCEIGEKCIAGMSSEELKGWLTKQYDQVIGYWDDLQKIAKNQ